jgi:hypothetical protein
MLTSAAIGYLLGFISDGRIASGVLLLIFLVPPAGSAGMISGAIRGSLWGKDRPGINASLAWAIVAGIGFGAGTGLEGEWTVAGAILFSVIGAITGWLVVGRITRSSVLEYEDSSPRIRSLVSLALGLILIVITVYAAIEFWNSIFAQLVD